MPNIRMLTAQRELLEKEKLKHQGTIKAKRNQETDTQDVAKKTNTDESARTAKKASRDAQVASAEVKLADQKAKNAAIGAAIGAIGAVVAVGVSFAKAAGAGESKQEKANTAQKNANAAQKSATSAKKEAGATRKEAQDASKKGDTRKAKELNDKADRQDARANQLQGRADKLQDKADKLQAKADVENAGDRADLKGSTNDKKLGKVADKESQSRDNKEDAAKNREEAGKNTAQDVQAQTSAINTAKGEEQTHEDKGLVGRILDNIKETVKDVVGGVKESVKETGEDIKSGANNLAHDVHDGIDDAVHGGAKNAVVGAAKDIKDGAVEGVKDIKDGVVNAATSIKDTAVGIKDSIKDAITGKNSSENPDVSKSGNIGKNDVNSLAQAKADKAASRNSDNDKGPTKKDIAQIKAFSDLFDALRELGGHGAQDGFKSKGANFEKGAKIAKAAGEKFKQIGENFSDVAKDTRDRKTAKDPSSAVATRQRARDFTEGKDQGSRTESGTKLQEARANATGKGTLDKLEANGSIAQAESTGVVGKLDTNAAIGKVDTNAAITKAEASPASLSKSEISLLENSGVKIEKDTNGNAVSIDKASLDSAKTANKLTTGDVTLLEKAGVNLTKAPGGGLTGGAEKGSLETARTANKLTTGDLTLLEKAGVKLTKDDKGNVTGGATKEAFETAKTANKIGDSDKAFLTRNGITAESNGTTKSSLDSANKEVKNAVIDQYNIIKARDGSLAGALFLAENDPGNKTGALDRISAKDKATLGTLGVKFGADNKVTSSPESVKNAKELVKFANDPSVAFNAAGKNGLTTAQQARFNELKNNAGVTTLDSKGLAEGVKASGDQGSGAFATAGNGFRTVGVKALGVGVKVFGALAFLLGADRDGLDKLKDKVKDLESSSARKSKTNALANDIKDPGEKQRFEANLKRSGGDLDKALDNADVDRNRANGRNVESDPSLRAAKADFSDARGDEGLKTDKEGAKESTEKDLKDSFEDTFGKDKGDDFLKDFDVADDGKVSLRVRDKAEGVGGFFVNAANSVADGTRSLFGAGKDPKIVQAIKDGPAKGGISEEQAAKLVNALNNSGQGAVAAKILEAVGSDKAASILNTKGTQSTEQKENAAALGKITTTPDGKLDFSKLSADDKQKALTAILGDGFNSRIAQAVSGDPELAKTLDPVLTNGQLDVNKLQDLQTKDPAAFKKIEGILTGGGTLAQTINTAKDTATGNIVSNDAVKSILNSGGIDAGLARVIGDKVAAGTKLDASGNKLGVANGGNGRFGEADLENKIGGSKVKGDKATGFNYNLLVFNVGLPALQFFLQQLDKLREAHEQGQEAKKKLEAANALLAKLGKDLRRTQGSVNGNGADVPPQ